MKANISNIQKTYSEIPGTWEFEGVTYQGYEHFTDLHFAHGWRDVVIPTITETQKLSNDFILVDDIVTKEVIELTSEELQAIEDAKVQDLNLQQYQELLPTDWYYARYIETGQEVPLEIKQQRLDIKEKYNNLIREINNE